LQDQDEDVDEDEADFGGGPFLADEIDEDSAVEVALNLFAGGRGGGEGVVEDGEEGGGENGEEDRTEVGDWWGEGFWGECPELSEGREYESDHRAVQKVEVRNVRVDYDVDTPEHVGEKLVTLEVDELAGRFDSRFRRGRRREGGGGGVLIVYESYGGG